MTTVMNGHAPIGADVLSRAEALALAECEQTIEQGLKTFVEVGSALARVREQKLYRAQYETFAEYCAARWNITDGRARQLVIAAETVTNVTVAGLPAPANEGQARALGQVPQDHQAEVWREVNETAGKVTAEKIRDAADKRKPDLAPVILATLAEGGRHGLDAKAIAIRFAEQPTEKDLTRALEKLTKSGEIVVTRTWANGKPRKWALAAIADNITPDVERVLAKAGAAGRTVWQIAFLLDSANPPVDRVQKSVNDLADRLADYICIVGATADGQTLWALTEMVDAAAIQTPEPSAVDSPTVPAGGSGQAGSVLPSPGTEPAAKSPYAVTPEQRQQIVDDAQRAQAISNAHRKADRLIPEVSGLITEIVSGVRYGEPGLITAEMVAGLRAEADRLEQWMEKQA